jgi:integrase
MSDGFYRPKYRDRKTGQLRVAKVYWARDPVSGERTSTGARSLEGAQAWRAERERRAANPHYAASHEATVGQWIERVNKLKTARKTEGTAGMYRVKLGHVARLFGEASPMAAITPESVDRFVETRQTEGASNNTIGKELTAIVQLCKHAKRRGEYAGDISALRPIGFSIEYTPRKAHLKRVDLPKLAKRLKAHELAAVKVIVATSARLSEYLRMQRIDVDTRQWLVSMRGSKTPRATRVVPIPTPFRTLLKQALPHLGKKWTRITHDLPARCLKAEIPRLTPNDLRRTHSTWLIEAGVAKGLVADSLGHVDSKMVERVYGHADPAATLAVMEAQIAVVRRRKTSKSRRS